MVAMPETDPFSTSPDPRFLFLTDALREAAAKVRYVADRRQGLTILYGPVGTGKTSLVRMLYGEYAARPDTTAVFVPNPDFDTGLALLKAIGDELGVPRKRAKLDQQAAFQAFLISEYAADRNVVLFLDEAQRFTGRILETIRAMLNFETDDAKLIQVVLSGQIELRDRLRDPSKKNLRSRIFTSSTLAPLTFEATGEMIRFRLAAADAPDLFEPGAVETVYQLSRGVPRDVLRCCAFAYQFALETGERVTPALVHATAPHDELERDGG